MMLGEVGLVVSMPGALRRRKSSTSEADGVCGGVRTIEWCDAYLATSGRDGTITLWQIDAPPPSASVVNESDLGANPVLTLAPADIVSVPSVCSMRWICFADQLSAGRRAGEARACNDRQGNSECTRSNVGIGPGILCCGHANNMFRVWNLRGESTDCLAASQDACLIAAPLKGATYLSVISPPLFLHDNLHHENLDMEGPLEPSCELPAESGILAGKMYPVEFVSSYTAIKAVCILPMLPCCCGAVAMFLLLVCQTLLLVLTDSWLHGA